MTKAKKWAFIIKEEKTASKKRQLFYVVILLMNIGTWVLRFLPVSPWLIWIGYAISLGFIIFGFLLLFKRFGK